MGYISIIAIAIALGLDTFSVGVAAGVVGVRRDWRAALHLACSFGFFQFAMTLGGYFLGASIGGLLANYDHWAAAALLFLVGGKMLYDAWGNEAIQQPSAAMTRGLTLITLSLATSIDALAVGLSLGMTGAPILLASVIIGFVALAMTLMGIFLGDVLGNLLGRRANALGGFVLIAIGLKILGEHLG